MTKSLIKEFLNQNLVAIGWNLGDLSNKSSNEIIELFENKYSDTRSAKQVVRFVKDINIGDYVITSDSESKNFYLGIITSHYYYSDKIKGFDSSGDLYSDIRNVEWLGEISKDSLKQSTQGTLGTPTTVYNINEDAKEDIIKIFLNGTGEIKQIRTLTLTKDDPGCLTYEMTVNFLSNILINEKDGHYHYMRRSVGLIGRTLVLFKYEGKLIGKGIFYDEDDEPAVISGIQYNGSYLVEKDSVVIFKEVVDLKKLQKYVPTIKTLTRDQIIDINYLDEINSMIETHLRGDTINLSAEIIRKYLDEHNLGSFEKPELEELLIKFKEEFGPEILEKLEGIDVINRIFLHDNDKSTLCYNLEFSSELSMGGIGGGSAYKYSLFKSNDAGKWMSGSSKKQKALSEGEAIDFGTKIRDALVNGAKHIENTELESINDYINLENDLNIIFNDCSVKSTSSWIHKYYVLIFPEKFPAIHSDNMKKDYLRKFRIEPLKGYYANDGQFNELAKNANIKLYSLFDKNILKLFGEDIPPEPFKSNTKRNLIYFGAPGTGKSFNLNQDKIALLNNHDENYERVTFHPDYSYANFCGTYKPVPNGESIFYEYVPGPFMRSLVKALKNPSEPFLLIIEEINRANVASVFGDVFQLLDRDSNNESMYPIETSEDIKSYLKKELSENFEKVKIPSNMFIWATMNSADQGVFPMDTAFKRRWDFKYFSINYNEELVENIKVELNNQLISLNDLRKSINEELLTYRINEDKLLGPFFAFNEYLNKEIPLDEFKETFKNKIIMYLFEDAARSKRNDLFSGVSKKGNLTYSQICEAFDEKGIEIFCDNIKEKFINEDE